MNDIKININGYARHGKDTVREMFQKHGLRGSNTSMMYAKHIQENGLIKYYATPEECYEDRVNHRADWYNIIRSVDDDSYWVKKCLEENDIYTGHRDRGEFERSKHLFDVTIWVDASRRGLSKEDSSSCNLDVQGHDFVIDNGLTLELTEIQVELILLFIKNRKVAENAYSD